LLYDGEVVLPISKRPARLCQVKRLRVIDGKSDSFFLQIFPNPISVPHPDNVQMINVPGMGHLNG